ncbi:hypothetical protein EDC44_11242 [Cricetibacter osteomyelitidis]|uniref:Nitroreductase family protein n=1 Tax=Cricetibacter osteomyelitidis TaxID=1521931 RepID=A0A4V6NS76_9PAST|nr:hypothetical protein [Cricetibacter osteomyelitidis]TCP94983.1 hypothetical protein EDC44_11242 [Cricetibacter osteomyelitidis]
MTDSLNIAQTRYTSKRLDTEFDLQAKGMHSSVIVALGYHADTDPNAAKPKARLSAEQVFTYL